LRFVLSPVSIYHIQATTYSQLSGSVKLLIHNNVRLNYYITAITYTEKCSYFSKFFVYFREISYPNNINLQFYLLLLYMSKSTSELNSYKILDILGIKQKHTKTAVHPLHMWHCFTQLSFLPASENFGSQNQQEESHNKERNVEKKFPYRKTPFCLNQCLNLPINSFNLLISTVCLYISKCLPPIMMECQQIKVKTIKRFGHFHNFSYPSAVQLCVFSLRTFTFLNCFRTNWMFLFITAIVLVFIIETGPEV
jgi:hypothetical protein